MDRDERERLAHEIQELEGLIAKAKDSQDSETCWAVYLLSRCLASRRKHLFQAGTLTPAGE